MSATLVAVVQAGSILYDSGATLAKAEGLIAEAAAGGPRLVVFPEAFLGGDPKGADFGARVGSRTPEGRKLFRRYFEDALDVPGPATARAGPNYAGECILTAEIDVGGTAEGKFDLDVAGHYVRPDVYKLEVNQRGSK